MSFPENIMAVNHLVIEYPKGLDIKLTFVGADGRKANTFAMVPPLLLRVDSNLEFVSMASGNLRTLLDLPGQESDNGGDDDDVDGDKTSEDDEDTDVDMEDPDLDQTVDLVSSDDDDEDEEEEHNSDLVYVAHPTEA